MPNPRPIAVVASDLHLDKHAWANRPNICGDSQHAFQCICEYAVNAGLPLILAGDLIDKKANESQTPGFLVDMFDELAAAGCPVYFIQGQHELQDVPWACRIHSHPTWIDVCNNVSQPFDIGGLAVLGIDWTPRDELQVWLDQIKGFDRACDVLVLHQVAEEFMGGITTAEMSFAQVPQAKLLIIGDLHESRLETHRGADGQRLHVLSPGSTNMRKIDEQPDKYFYVLHDNLYVEKHRLPTRPVFAEGLLTEEDVDWFVDQYPALLEDRAAVLTYKPSRLIATPLLRVSYAAGLQDVYDRVVRAVGDAAHVFFKELPSPAESEKTAEAAEFQTKFELQGLVGCLDMAMDEMMEPEAFAICQKLLQSAEPAKTLSELKTKHFETATQEEA